MSTVVEPCNPALLPHVMFETQAARQPDAPALLCREGALSYRELNERANQLARYLSTLDGGAGRRVALCLPRSAEMVAAILAVMKAGATAVPLDEALPAARKHAILSDAQPAVLLTDNPDEGSGTLAGTTVVLAHAWPVIASHSTENVETTRQESQPLSVLYTSGVTGQPKGVVVSARAILHHMRWMWAAYPFRPSDVALNHRSYMLISSTWDYLGALLHGVPSAVASDSEANDPAALWKRLVAHGVSYVSASPAFWDAILDQAERRTDEWRTLRVGTISGEQVSVRIVRRWQRMFPDAVLLNVYGSTECVRPAVYDTRGLAEDAERVPVGAPLSGVRTWIVDEQMRPLTRGELGELCVSGPCLADGYFNLPALTQERFVRRPELTGDDQVLFRTGDIARIGPGEELEIVGRRDQQVKIRGFRVELGDVEVALLQSDTVRQAAVIVTEDPLGGRRLVAYVVAAGDRAAAAADLRQFAGSRLPDYMVPALFVFLDDMPLTRSGKTDWSALPPPERQLSVPEQPGAFLTATEQSVVAIWSEVFNIASIGRDEDFFELGGHSLMAMQIAARVLDRFGVELPSDVIFSTPTIRELASAVDIARAGAKSSGANLRG